MRPEDIDDLFKGKLEDHSSALPSPLWNRLEERMQQQQAKSDHSVDALFKAKLAQHGTPLPAGLWSRIEERMNPEQKKVRPMWAWYAAASIALLLSVVGFWRLNNETNTTQIAIETPKTNSVKTEKEIPYGTTEIIETEPAIASKVENSALAQVKTVPAGSDNLIKIERASGTDNRTTDKDPKVIKEENSALKAQKMPVTAPVLKAEEPMLAQAKPAELKKEAATTETALPNVPDVTTSMPQMAQAKPLKVDIILASHTPQQAEETVNAPEEEESSVRSKAIFARKVAKQLWNIKNGEKPNLEEIGLAQAQNYTSGVKNKIQTLSKTINL